jgi:hypothetical protein
MTAVGTPKQAKFPFELGQMVGHRASSESRGIVTAIVTVPAGCNIEVTWGPGSVDVFPHFVLEQHHLDEGADAYAQRSHELPYEWGRRVQHRVDATVGVVTGYRVCERGPMVRVSWDPDTSGWYQLCELEPEAASNA